MQSEIGEFLVDLQNMHPMQGVENRNVFMNRQKLLSWMDDALGTMCAAMIELADRPHLRGFQENICEGVDSVFLCLVDAMEIDDKPSWDLASQLTGDRGELMRKMRVQYLEKDPPLQRLDLVNILLVTNAVEEVFFLLSKVEADFNPYSSDEGGSACRPRQPLRQCDDGELLEDAEGQGRLSRGLTGLSGSGSVRGALGNQRP